MIKVRVHITNPIEYIDKDVFVEIMLPTLPRRGDTLYINRDSLEKQAKKSIEIAWRYFSMWWPGSIKESEPRVITEDEREQLSFEDAILVQAVSFREGADYVDIELGKMPDED